MKTELFKCRPRCTTLLTLAVDVEGDAQNGVNTARPSEQDTPTELVQLLSSSEL